ncbi:DUF5666 domain-containing protein [Blastococcus sp. SYSU DS0619]
MQDWVFDRDGARTPRSPGTPPADETAAPAAPAARPGRRRRWAVAGAAALAVLGIGAGAAAALGAPAEPQPAAVATAAAPLDQSAAQDRPSRQLPTVPGQSDDDAAAPEEETTTGTATAPWSALHEEREVQQPDGSTLTIAVQGGTVTALDSASVTVESSDGFSRTYAVTAATRVAGGGLDALQVGDAVLVEGVVEGGTATAATIRPAGGGAPGGRAPTAPGGDTGTETETETEVPTQDA